MGSLLEGSIRRAGHRVRVSVQLTEAASEAHIWSEDHERELRDIFAIQSSIARAVAGNLEVQLLANERQRIERAPTTSLEALDLYLLGRHHLLRRNHDGLLRAIALFEEALQRDPSYALAAAGLGLHPTPSSRRTSKAPGGTYSLLVPPAGGALPCLPGSTGVWIPRPSFS